MIEKKLTLIRDRQLVQIHLTTIGPITAYMSSEGKRTIVKDIDICNTGDVEAIFSIFLDDDGEIYDKTTAIHFEQPIPAKTTVTLRKELFLTELSVGNIGLSTNIVDALTFTINGTEMT